MKFTTDIFELFDEKWALLSAGTENNFNMMTISWGGLGTIWNKPVATVYVRKSRYTQEYLDDNDYFTISFFPEEYRSYLKDLGSESGRDMDKIHESGLTVVKAGESVTFKEATTTLLCKTLLKQPILPENMPKDVMESMYPNNDFHDMYIGEVVEIIQ